MKTLSISFAFGCALAAGFNASAAAAQMFDCKIAQVGWGGWVTDRYVFQVDLAKKQATAIDALINRMNQKPIAARIADANERTIRLKWEIEKVPAMNRATGSSSGNINLAYTAVLNAKKKTVSVRGTVTSGRAAGSSGTSGTGKCKITGNRISMIGAVQDTKLSGEKRGAEQACGSSSENERKAVGCPAQQATVPFSEVATKKPLQHDKCDGHEHNTLANGVCF